MCLVGVFCRYSVSLPEKIEALRGSCVIIKCTFEIEDKYDRDLTENATTGLWLKDGTEEDPHQVFNSRDHKPDNFNGKITGKLHEKNCTTVFYNVSSNHNGKYYFRIKSEYLKYTYKQSFSTIDVIESPPKPRVQLYVAQDQEEVLEGSSVSLRCSAETLCSSPPATLTWSSTPRIPLSESSRLQELISDLNFTATHREHGVTFTCTITYQLQDKNKTAQDSITVHVQYSPKNTSVSVVPSSSVLEGSSVTLICSSDANPAVNYTWSRESEGQLEQLQTGDTLTFNRTDPTHRGWYHCTAQNQHGAQNSSVKLDIQYAPKTISVSVIPSSSVLEGSSVTLICSSDANPAVNYTWSRESEGQLEQLQTGDTLTFNRTDPTHRGWYHCTAQNQHGAQNSSVKLDIQYAPKNMSALAIPSSSVLEGSSVTLICSSDANPAVNYTWSRESEGQLEQLQPEQNLTFNRTDPTHRGWYHCTAQNQHGAQNSSVKLDIQYAPKISSSSSCNRTNVTVCFCEADGNPSPELEWHLSGRPVTNSSNTFISEERLSSTGLRSSITLHQSLTNTSTLQCVSNNIRGTASQLFHLLHVTLQKSGFHHFSFLVGAAGGATVMMILCGILLIRARRESNTRLDGDPGLMLTDWEDESGPVYANSTMLSPNGASTQNHKREPLHYATIDFTNIQPESEEIRGVSSLTTEYAVVRCYPGGVSEAESSIGGDRPNSSISAVMKSEENQTILEQEADIGVVFSQPSEDNTYESITT
ncbi:myelin-associated glycoprotein-like [Onychostoma macrolepis]|uniref:myelin-associated glycoprotein-like n=1 Tax=Onychostoma macrolepis TaxID=369639 RepID=UPI00272C5EA6|nr:myelin-associated glycoprotein-like [Onychostoma macrolepis]